MLKIPEDSNQDTTREAYIKLVKKVHPDSGHDEANADRFTEVDSAFKVLQSKFAKDRRGISDDDTEVMVYDIKVRSFKYLIKRFKK